MNINIFAPIGGTGYGNASYNIIKSLKRQNHTVSLVPIGRPNIESEDQLKIIQECIDNQLRCSYDSPCVKIWHQFDLLSRVGNGKYYAYPFFEIDTFNDLEKHNLRMPDHLVVSSQWAKEIIEKNDIKKPISIVNLGVDSEIFHPIDVAKRPKNFVFLTIGKWEIRKSHDVVIECFNRAFNDNDNVELWLVTHNPFLNNEQEKEWINLVESSKLRQKIKIFPRLETQKDLAQVISYSDCGLYVSRAEGWNLELLETMAMNKPVIATNYSAHTEYCTPNNSYLVDIVSETKAVDNKWFNGLGHWADIDDKAKDQIIDYMRHIYNNNINTNPSGVETATKFSWDNTANQLIRCIQ
jgi:glycosyltransferase involved in cell wall biosynthesis